MTLVISRLLHQKPIVEELCLLLTNREIGILARIAPGVTKAFANEKPRLETAFLAEKLVLLCPYAIDWAACYNFFDVLQYLCANQSHFCTVNFSFLSTMAKMHNSQYEIVRRLHSDYPTRSFVTTAIASAMADAIDEQHYQKLKWLEESSALSWQNILNHAELDRSERLIGQIWCGLSKISSQKILSTMSGKSGVEVLDETKLRALADAVFSQMGENSIFVAFAGLMGAGKTKQAKALAKLFGLRHCSTQPVEENPYLEQFYADKASCSFQMQIYLLKARFEEHRDCSSCVRAAVQDRSIYDDLIFAEMLTKAGHMSKLDLQTYQEFFATIIALVEPPKYIIFLDVSPETALARIRRRGRACEAGITIEYMRDLHAQYEESFAKVTRGIPVLRVPEFFDLKASIQKLLDEGIYDDTDY